jgi:hypothetical protein
MTIIDRTGLSSDQLGLLVSVLNQIEPKDADSEKIYQAVHSLKRTHGIIITKPVRYYPNVTEGKYKFGIVIRKNNIDGSIIRYIHVDIIHRPTKDKGISISDENYITLEPSGYWIYKFIRIE